jgi:hypothetical protein
MLPVQWRQFKFFDKDLVKVQGKPLPFLQVRGRVRCGRSEAWLNEKKNSSRV